MLQHLEHASMGEQLWDTFISFFANPSIFGIGLAAVFGAVWLLCYWPPLFKNAWLWAIMAGSAILTLSAMAFIEIPLASGTGQVLMYFWSQEVIMRWFALAVIVQLVLSGLVQEGCKLVPVVIYWWRKGKNLDPKLGLVIGAVGGAGFGILEAQWIHNTLLASGWGWANVQAVGLSALVVFWERFLTVAFHTAACALAGYGLARGWGWQFYLLVSFLHALLYCPVLFGEMGLLSSLQMYMLIGAVVMLTAAAALWLRWGKPAAAVEARKAH